MDKSNRIKSTVVIVGLSYSGLAAAHKLLSQGIDVVVVDKNPGLVPSAYYAGVEGKVYVEHRVLRDVGLETRMDAGDPRGVWIDSLELLSRLLVGIYGRKGVVITGYDIEPFFVEKNGELWFAGAILRIPSEDHGLMEDHCVVESKYLIDASGLSAEPTISVIESLRPGVVPQGPGPVVPGSRDVVEKTQWVIEDMILATGLAAASIFGATLPFPDVTPLLESGVRAADMIIESLNSIEKPRNKERIDDLYGLM
ncbi:FAD-dependent monooxygenase [Desulfurococcaceae archaeon MEX13E-LK6-19]|nr:FAD-dependent monooxygenase [Desulfurococcaceae archaeon MEX13E-LK6-19]